MDDATLNKLGNFSLYSSIFGSIGQAYGAFAQARAQKDEFRFQARMADINSRISELSAQSELRRGNQQASRIRMQGGQLKARQRAAMAANGIALDSDTALDVFTSTDFMAESDAITARSNALRAAWGHRLQAVNSRNQGTRLRGAASGMDPVGQGAASLLTSAGNVAGQAYLLNR